VVRVPKHGFAQGANTSNAGPACIVCTILSVHVPGIAFQCPNRLCNFMSFRAINICNLKYSKTFEINIGTTGRFFRDDTLSASCLVFVRHYGGAPKKIRHGIGWNVVRFPWTRGSWRVLFFFYIYFITVNVLICVWSKNNRMCSRIIHFGWTPSY
jgi:hypothetical protein